MHRAGRGYYIGEGLGHLKDSERFKRAFNWWLKASGLGCIESQVDLGDCYRLGKGAEITYKQALYWYEKVIKEEKELMAKPNDKPSWQWNKTAIARAYNTLGGMMYAGQGSDPDTYGALQYFDKAVELGHANAGKNAETIRAAEAKKATHTEL